MNKVLKSVGMAALLAAGSTLVMAQAQNQNPTGDKRPLSPGGVDNPSVNDQKAEPTNPTKMAPPANTGTGSRPLTPGKENAAPAETKDTKGQKKSPN